MSSDFGLPQAQQRRLRDAEHEMDALRAETAAKDEAIQQQKQRAREAEQRASELQQELENNEGGWLVVAGDIACTEYASCGIHMRA